MLAQSPRPLAFEAVFHENAAYVWRAVRALGAWDADLGDVSQEVFLVVHRQLAGFRGESSIRPWIYAIGVRVVGDPRRRASRRRGRRAGDSLPEPSVSGSLDEDV